MTDIYRFSSKVLLFNCPTRRLRRLDLHSNTEGIGVQRTCFVYTVPHQASGVIHGIAGPPPGPARSRFQATCRLGSRPGGRRKQDGGFRLLDAA